MTTLDLLTLALSPRDRQRQIALDAGAPLPLLLRDALAAAERPEVQAAHPVECRLILDRRDRLRAARSGRGLVQHG